MCGFGVVLQNMCTQHNHISFRHFFVVRGVMNPCIIAATKWAFDACAHNLFAINPITKSKHILLARTDSSTCEGQWTKCIQNKMRSWIQSATNPFESIHFEAFEVIQCWFMDSDVTLKVLLVNHYDCWVWAGTTITKGWGIASKFINPNIVI